MGLTPKELIWFSFRFAHQSHKYLSKTAVEQLHTELPEKKKKSVAPWNSTCADRSWPVWSHDCTDTKL